jgi:hypothetical protein
MKKFKKSEDGSVMRFPYIQPGEMNLCTEVKFENSIIYSIIGDPVDWKATNGFGADIIGGIKNGQ